MQDLLEKSVKGDDRSGPKQFLSVNSFIQVIYSVFIEGPTLGKALPSALGI